MLESLLIANRGEIARRIIRTAKRMGIRTVAVCSEADVEAPFAREADARHIIGPPPPKESYLNADAIIDVAHRERIDAVHPGYGFLSENARFAERVEREGFRFVGPRPDTIRRVGSKLDARAVAVQADVPVVPGCDLVKDVEQARAEAAAIGYPVVLKASAGGGGIGMYVVTSEKKLARAYDDARRKGASFFDDDTVYIEKLIEAPAHVEVQIFGDGQGRVFAVGERDCTVQRRNQKVVEEAPSPRLDTATRDAMFDAAERLGRAVDYRNAGTVEMIYCGSGPEAGRFYFLEVNSRLQVEHPVTEAVTGLDLVQIQLEVAAGQELPEALNRPSPRGWAIEARICAEDPDKRFFPSPGTLTHVEFPADAYVRVDSGVEAGSVVSPTYDSLLAKLIVHGKDRKEAIARLVDAVRRTRVEGTKTNLPVFVPVLEHPTFSAGAHSTGFLADLGYKS